MAKKPTTVHVVLDTNTLFTQHIDKLLSSSISDFIKSESKALGLDISFYIPDVVQKERQRQMITRALELIPGVRKIEALLGMQIVNDQIVSDRIVSIIDREISDHKLTVIEADYASIKWNELVDNACFRRIPFSTGEKEKGFKDSIIIEAFSALVFRLPKSPSTTIAVLLCGDKDMSDAAKARFQQQKQVHVCDDIDDLRTIVNAVASNVSQDTADEYVRKASRIFWDFEQKKGLYDGWGIWPKIQKAFLSNAKSGFTIKSEAIKIVGTTFIKKELTKIFFKSTISVRLTGTRLERREAVNALTGYINPYSSTPNMDAIQISKILSSQPNSPMTLEGQRISNALSRPTMTGGLLGTSDASYVEKKSTAEAIYEAHWTVLVGRTGRLSKPELTQFVAQPLEWTDA